MLAPPFSPVLSATGDLPFFGAPAENAAELLTVGPLPEDFEPKRRPAPTNAKGILMTGYTAGGSRFDDLLDLIDRTELNAVVIDIKDERGEISWIPRSPQARWPEPGITEDPLDLGARPIRQLKAKDVYVIGRIVTFQDSILSKVRPDLAIQDLERRAVEEPQGPDAGSTRTPPRRRTTRSRSRSRRSSSGSTRSSSTTSASRPTATPHGCGSRTRTSACRTT